MAWSDSRLEGFCWTKMHDERTGEIYIIAVDPDRQRRGLGRALVSAGAGYLAEEGAESVVLYVDADNGAALGLYRSFGFGTESVSSQFAG